MEYGALIYIPSLMGTLKSCLLKTWTKNEKVDFGANLIDGGFFIVATTAKGGKSWGKTDNLYLELRWIFFCVSWAGHAQKMLSISIVARVCILDSKAFQSLYYGQRLLFS